MQEIEVAQPAAERVSPNRGIAGHDDALAAEGARTARAGEAGAATSESPASEPRSSEGRMAKSDAKIWCSDLLSNSEYFKNIGYALPPPPHPTQYDFWLRRYERGEWVSPEDFPAGMVARRRFTSLPDIMLLPNRVVVVRDNVKKELEQFRLGRSHLVEVPIWDEREKQTFEGPFYILNIAEQRDVFLPEETEAAYKNNQNAPWRVRGFLEDDKLTVRAEPPEDVDLWMHPNLAEVFFLSAPLVQAIKTAKIRRFGLFSCRTVE